MADIKHFDLTDDEGYRLTIEDNAIGEPKYEQICLIITDSAEYSSLAFALSPEAAEGLSSAIQSWLEQKFNKETENAG